MPKCLKWTFLIASLIVSASLYNPSYAATKDWNNFELDWKQNYSTDTLDFILQYATSTEQLAKASLFKALNLFTRDQAKGMLPLLKTAERFARVADDQLMLSRTIRLFGLYYRMLDMPEK